MAPESGLRVYELINPSDAYTLAAPSHEVAAMACLHLGDGAYGLREVGGDFVFPVFLFGGFAEWVPTAFGMSQEEYFGPWRREHCCAVVKALRSVVIGSPGDRQIYEAAVAAIPDPAARAAFRDAWHEGRRPSLNDIGRYALGLADAMAPVCKELRQKGEDAGA